MNQTANLRVNTHAWLLAMLHLLTNFAAAQTDTPQLAQPEVGVAGVWRVGHWCPVAVDIECRGDFRGKLEIDAPDGETAPVTFAEQQPVEVAAGQTARVIRNVKVGRRTGNVVFRLLDRDGQIADELTAPLVGGLGPQQAVLLQVGGEGGLRRDLLADYEVRDAEPEELPSNPDLLQAIDAVWVSSHGGAAEKLTEAQVQALSGWVQLGGHLVLCSGRRTEQLAKSESWSSLLPGKFVAGREWTNGGDVERLGESQERLPPFFSARRFNQMIPMQPHWLPWLPRVRIIR